MNNDEPTMEKLIKYIDGDLTDKEKTSFEKLLSESDELRQELESLILAKTAIRGYGLRNQVASIHQEMMKDINFTNTKEKAAEHKIYPFIRSSLKYAASVLIVLCSIIIYLYITTSTKGLYKENYEPYKLSISRGIPLASGLEKAFINGDYRTVIADFTNIQAPDNKDFFLAAQSYQSIHQFEQAIDAYKHVSNSSDNSFKDDAAYYLALTYLETNQPMKARTIFEAIYQDRDHLYHDKVRYWTLFKLKLLTLRGVEK